ncbi:hypothetical protein [Rhodohalobacter mucosus]|uniref:Tetratricopeptide repeat protein n=1 Tax=Rhodohalobacter mucosus TaxID=2079485 RepID=A0A316TQK2_9BACT|nr:hypothetical protein [Rhodohalobacter mucosus]PWN06887.1 hypothetical protein DDZ15_06330 [Rhodohalobacter mucosus]
MKILKRILFAAGTVILLLGACTNGVQAQVPVLIKDEAFKDHARQAIDSLYNRNSEAALDILSPWMDQYPDHPMWDLWEGMQYWWYVLQDLPGTEYDEAFFTKMKEADFEAGRVLRRSPDHPDALIVRAVSNAYAARHNSNRENWITSMNLGRRAFQAHERLVEVMPDLPDNDFAEGLKKYYSAYIPENYPVVRAVSWFLPEGDYEEGLRMLRIASENGIFARPEASYFLGYILLNYENEYEDASFIFKDIVESYPDNGYYRRLYARSLIQMDKYSEAREFALETISYWDSLGPQAEFYTVLREEIFHWLGRAYYHTGEYRLALEAFITSYRAGLDLPNRREREFHTFSAYFAGRTNELLNNPESAKRYYLATLEQRAAEEAIDRAKERLDRL